MFIQMNCFPSVGNAARLMCWTSVIWARPSLYLQSQPPLTGRLSWDCSPEGETAQGNPSTPLNTWREGTEETGSAQWWPTQAQSNRHWASFGAQDAPSGHRQHCCAVLCCAQRSRGCGVSSTGTSELIRTWGWAQLWVFLPWAGFAPMDKEVPSHLHHSVIL